MKNSKKNGFPRAMLKNLAQDISKLISTNEGCLSILEIIEEIPYDVRADVIEALSSFMIVLWWDFTTSSKWNMEKSLKLFATGP